MVPSHTFVCNVPCIPRSLCQARISDSNWGSARTNKSRNAKECRNRARDKHCPASIRQDLGLFRIYERTKFPRASTGFPCPSRKIQRRRRQRQVVALLSYNALSRAVMMWGRYRTRGRRVHAIVRDCSRPVLMASFHFVRSPFFIIRTSALTLERLLY